MTIEELLADARAELERSEQDGIFIAEMLEPWDSALSGYYHAMRRQIAVLEQALETQ